MRVAILLLIAFKIIVILKINIHNTSVKEKIQHVLALILLSWKAIFRAGRLDIPLF